MISRNLKLIGLPFLMGMIMSCEAFTIRTSPAPLASPSSVVSTRAKTLHTFSQQNQHQQQRLHSRSFAPTSTSLRMSEETSKPNNLPMLLDPGTKGGAIFLALVLFIVPILGYEVATTVFGLDGIEVGKWIGVGFTLFTTVLWVGTYIFRVATKDMTYVSVLFIGR